MLWATKKRTIRSAIATVFFVPVLSGCSGLKITDEDGSTHHLIIGIGVVSIPSSGAADGVVASRAKVLGVHASSQPAAKFAAGLASSSAAVIPESVDEIIVEVDQSLFGPLTIRTQSFPKECLSVQ
jgi:hypothetical protein